jgi:hypothetical protein
LRGFWHGSPLQPYQLLCLRTFIQFGHRVEVFSYEDLSAPSWVECRDAAEIFPTGHVLRYQFGFGRGSPSLHSNLFRYAMLHKLGGWWIDLDIVALRPDLPEAEMFFTQATEGYATLGSSVLKFPAGHPLLAEALERCIAAGETVDHWGATGPLLLTELVSKYDLMSRAQPWQTSYPVPWTEIAGLFDPERLDEIASRCERASFLHLFNELWRGSGIPQHIGPPAGSYLDRLFTKCELQSVFRERIMLDDLLKWIHNRRAKIELQEKVEDQEKKRQAAQAERPSLPELTIAKYRAFLLKTRWRITTLLCFVGRLLKSRPADDLGSH